ncbi:MAG: ABC transporter substrate-binding protein [Eubacteriaceae bacterium]|nr:ABC transporter substrate-binding protein [Eubacteriaceae bacterium]
MNLRKTTAFALALMSLALYCSCAVSAPTAGSTIEIEDLIGRAVTVPIDPQRIAAITGPSYEMAYMLGASSRIAMVKSGHTTNYPLALLTNPSLADCYGVAANPSSTVNIEEYLSCGIDLVIYYDNSNELKKFGSVGIPAVVLTLNTGLFDTLDAVVSQSLSEYIQNSTAAVEKLASILGGDAIDKCDKWKAYVAEKTAMLYDRTSSMPQSQRKSVYWGNTWGENVLATYPLTNRYYEIWLCGGNLLGPTIGNGNFPEVTSEQLFAWDPEIILVDNHGNYPELVIRDMYREGSRWESLSAVKAQQLHRIPAGIFFLDKGTTTTLMLLWLATIVQPELFADINIIEEIQYYYSEFYGFELSSEQASRVVEGWYERIGDEPDYD